MGDYSVHKHQLALLRSSHLAPYLPTHNSALITWVSATSGLCLSQALTRNAFPDQKQSSLEGILLIIRGHTLIRQDEQMFSRD